MKAARPKKLVRSLDRQRASETSFRMSQLVKVAQKLFNPQLNFVRHRQFKDRWHKYQQGAGPLLRRHGYEETIWRGGLLPRGDDTKDRRLPMPIYRPGNPWTERKALFGQNDYIDILGNERIHPTTILYNLPRWLRGVNGNEYQNLIRKQRTLVGGTFPLERPTRWYLLRQRINWLHKFLNRKTKYGRPSV